VRVATLVLAVMFAVAGCNDLRDFRGTWHGPHVGDDSDLNLGIMGDPQATLDVEEVDSHQMTATLSVDGLVAAQSFVPSPGAEADVLSGMSFAGSPLRVYLGFVPTTDGNGDVLAIIALYQDRRIEVRLLRGGPLPIYAIFALAEP
jgi:hypothetical protein